MEYISSGSWFAGWTLPVVSEKSSSPFDGLRQMRPRSKSLDSGRVPIEWMVEEAIQVAERNNQLKRNFIRFHRKGWAVDLKGRWPFNPRGKSGDGSRSGRWRMTHVTGTPPSPLVDLRCTLQDNQQLR